MPSPDESLRSLAFVLIALLIALGASTGSADSIGKSKSPSGDTNEIIVPVPRGSKDAVNRDVKPIWDKRWTGGGNPCPFCPPTTGRSGGGNPCPFCPPSSGHSETPQGTKPTGPAMP